MVSAANLTAMAAATFWCCSVYGSIVVLAVAARLLAGFSASAACFPPALLGVGSVKPTRRHWAAVVVGLLALVGLFHIQRSVHACAVQRFALRRSVASVQPPSCFGPPPFGYRHDLCRLMRADAGSSSFIGSSCRALQVLCVRSRICSLLEQMGASLLLRSPPRSPLNERAHVWVGDLRAEADELLPASCIDAAFRASRASVKRGHWPSPWRSIHSYGLSIN